MPSRFSISAVSKWTFVDGLNTGHSRPALAQRFFFWRQARLASGRRLLKLVWWMLQLQLLAAILVTLSGLAQLARIDVGLHGLLLLVVGLLFLGLFGGAWWITDLLARQIRDTSVARAFAAGAVASLIEQRFATWRLTPAEHDVALFTLKGFETTEIAELRQTSQGTVRVQLGRIYTKAGVNSRGAFQSLFFEELLDVGPRISGTENVGDPSVRDPGHGNEGAVQRARRGEADGVMRLRTAMPNTVNVRHAPPRATRI